MLVGAYENVFLGCCLTNIMKREEFVVFVQQVLFFVKDLTKFTEVGFGHFSSHI